MLRADGRAALLFAALTAASVVVAQGTGPGVPDQFTATTTAMTPSDVTLRIDVREWSDEASRAAAVAALAQESDVEKALAELPTLGYVWESTSAVGYSLKYAHRASTPDGERVTFVTNKRIGSYDYKPWTANAPASQTDLDYSVIELYLDDSGNGIGTMSLASDVDLDEGNALVSLARGAESGSPLLVNAKLEPKPYWVTGAAEAERTSSAQ